MADLEQLFLAEIGPDQLQSDRQLGILRKATGQTQSTVARQITGDREDVGKVHLQGIVRLFTHLERRGGCRGGNNGVHLFKCPVEIIANQGSDLLGAQIIGVVKTTAEDIGAQDDAAFDLGAKSLSASFAIELQRFVGIDPFAVADAIIPGEIGTGFGGGDDVVGGDGVLWAVA